MNSEDTYSRRPTFDDIVKLRGRRLAWLDKLIIRGRNALRMKSLLRVIEGHDRSNVGVYLDIATIATGMGCEERTARRAINDCRAAGLLPKNEKSSRGRVNAYKIQWDVVAQMIIDHPETIHLIAPHEAPPRPRELPFDAEQPRTLVPRTPDTCAREPRTLVHPTPDTCAGNPGHLRPEPRTLVQGTPDTCASEQGVDDLIHRARVLKPNTETKEETKEETKKRETAFPAELDNEEFQSLWTNWTQHLQERGKELTSAATAQQLAKLAALGTARAIIALEHSLANNWVTIHEPRSPPPVEDYALGPGQRYNPHAVGGDI